MLLLVLVACGVTVRPTCIDTRTELADDEVTHLGFSPADVLGVVVGTHVDDARWSYGERTEVTVTVARGEGPAALIESEAGTIETPNGNLFGRDVLYSKVMCLDYVEVPTSLAVDTEDGEMAFVTDSAAAGANHLAAVGVSADLDADEMAGVPPSSREADAGFADATWDDGEMSGGRVGWTGETESGAWAEYLLQWGTN